MWVPITVREFARKINPKIGVRFMNGISEIISFEK